MKEHEKKFLEFLSLKSSYDYNPEFIKIVQTHISIVAIAPPFVFKIKKNIKLSFLDYSSIEKRKHLILKEIQLNQRLCGQTYIEMLPIYEFEGVLSFEKFFHGAGKIYDYALKMNYMNSEFCMKNMLEKKKWGIEHTILLVSQLKHFYDSQKRLDEMSEFGKPAALNQMFQNNLNELGAVSNGIFEKPLIDMIRYFSELFYAKYSPALEKRYQGGYIKDGHGDLRLEHIYVLGKQLCIYDCIEFNDEFRYIDILNDIAFLLMELDFFGHHQVSSDLSERVYGLMQDESYRQVLIFYKIYRALVRAKVNCILSSEDEISIEKKDSALHDAHKFISLAWRYVLTMDEPTIFVVMGKTATGKSSVSNRLAKDTGIDNLSTDITRKQMAEINIYSETPAEIKKAIYSSEFTTKVYIALFENAANLLQTKKQVILDGTFSKKKYREMLIAKFPNVRIIFIEVEAPDFLKTARLKKRELEGGVSDARERDKQLIDSLYENPEELPASMRITLENSEDFEKVTANLYHKIIQLNQSGS